MTADTIIFSKYHGTGNDFIMIDNRAKTFPVKRGLISAMCNRHFGIGADGLILIENHPSLDFTMRYFNADGKESTMCGNGGRCAVAFAGSLGLVKGNRVPFMAPDGEHQAEIQNNIISLKMRDVLSVEQHDEYFFMNTGSPHYVTFVENIDDLDVVTLGRRIRYAEAFKPGGTNVNFARHLEPGKIYNRTYERGVENETLSCGTGSVAAAISAAILRQYDINSITVRTPGGELTVRFQPEPGGRFADIRLEGPAVFVFSGTVNTTDIEFQSKFNLPNQ
ncbi:MAG: diaminopimelate epimerase [Chlorobi bacterium]|nr:diaminopimelate epimerase [Chlorobiota bacterium]